MKTIIRMSLVAVAMIFCVAVNAQVSLGVKAGVNLSNYGGDIDDTDAKAGFNVGLTAEFGLPLTSMYILSGLELNTKGAKYEEGGYKLTSNAMYLQLPVHFGYRISALETFGVSFHAGPYIAYGIGGKTKIEGVKFDTFGDDGLKEFDFGLGLGVNAEFSKLSVGIGYDFGLANIARNIEMEIGDLNLKSDVKVRNMNAYLSVGYKF